MPNKHNANGRHHIPKMKFRVRNWREYDAALRARGSLTMWVTPEAIECWTAQPRTTRGGQSSYSDLAIETSLMLRLVFRQALGQTEGLMASIFDLLELDLSRPTTPLPNVIHRSRSSYRRARLRSPARNSKHTPARETRTCS